MYCTILLPVSNKEPPRHNVRKNTLIYSIFHLACRSHTGVFDFFSYYYYFFLLGIASPSCLLTFAWGFSEVPFAVLCNCVCVCVVVVGGVYNLNCTELNLCMWILLLDVAEVIIRRQNKQNIPLTSCFQSVRFSFYASIYHFCFSVFPSLWFSLFFSPSFVLSIATSTTI